MIKSLRSTLSHEPDYQLIKEAAGKPISSLTSYEFYHYIELIQRRHYYVLSNKEVPMEELDPLLGTYAWARNIKDEWVGKLEVIKTGGVIYNPQDRSELEWKSQTYREVCANHMEFEKYGLIYPIVVSRQEDRLTVIKGTSRLMFALSNNIKEVKAFVVEIDSNNYSKNRTFYAKESGIVPPDLDMNKSTPVYCPLLTDQDIAVLQGMTMGDKLDSILKKLHFKNKSENLDHQFKDTDFNIKDLIQIPGAGVFRVCEPKIEGGEGCVFKVEHLDSNRFFALKIRKNSISEIARVEELKSLGFKVANIIYSGPNWDMKEWIDGKRGDVWVKDWVASGCSKANSGYKGLLHILDLSSKQGVCVGGLSAINLILTKHGWVIVDSAPVARMEDPRKEYLRRMATRWDPKLSEALAED